MISWRTLRITCLVLLLIPVVHLVYLVSRDTVATLNSSPDAWAAEVDAYARKDRASKLPDQPVVVVGGRRVKLWRGLEDLLAPQPVLMRGLGDATVDDLIHNYERLIGFYRPGAVVLLPSSSEFRIRANKTAENLAQGIEELVELNRYHAADSTFYVITPLKTPLYAADDRTVEETTRLLHDWAASLEQVKILDANRLLVKPDGRPNPAYYRADGINLNEHGYLRLSVLLQTALDGAAETLNMSKS
ncbi:hypothetical protein DWB85_07930 [Seongchinamella sediminis]|uniref:SGNH hydrolase-type esterase domain-containing protein n=1 Tax=Seongchinamella sediminis TaxID=2283635 RepID=A0A3L7E079_9GAMM|nr:hypothetical protein [Seongchinamella sediminis]RLQ22210.1 hypothetical protein DWB85_07930 [Seongchinamella sediminis]